MAAFRITIEDRVKKMISIRSKEEFIGLRDTALQMKLVTEIRKGKKDLKHKLLQIVYSCRPNDDGTLRGSTRLSNTVGMDIDFDPTSPDYTERMASVPQLVMDHCDELGLKMMERSATKGYHIVFARHPDMTQEQNLRWASNLLGVPFDENAKDITRVFYTTTASPEDLLYLSPDLFDDTIPEMSIEQEPTEQTPLVLTNCTADFPAHYDGVPYEDIVTALAEQLGGVPTHGSRNQFIFSMACHLRYICNDDPRWIARVLPTYGEDATRWQSSIQSACRRAQARQMPRNVNRAIRMARLGMSDAKGEGAVYPMPQMPSRLPRVIRLLTSRVPDHYKPAVAQAVFSPLATHLYDVRFCYVDNTLHEPAVMTVLMAPQSIGKGVVNEPIEYIMADIKARDELNRQREQEWKSQTACKAANKDRPARPEDLCIQYVSSDMTNAAYVQRLYDANGRFLYTKMNEIELLKKLETKSTDVSELIRLAFDTDDYGQERVGNQSVTCRTKVRWNWNASTTVERGQNFFSKGLQDGTLSRLNIATIIVPDDYDELIPVIGTYGPKFADQLAPFINYLNEAQGLVRCRQAEQLAIELLKENRRFFELSDDDNFRVLSYRANLQAYIKAMILYICNGRKWCQEIAEFVRWSERYDLWCKMRFFSDLMENSCKPQSCGRRGPRNMLEMLPREFSKQEFEDLRASLGKPRNGDSTLAVWIHRGFIVQLENGLYRKTDEYLKSQGHPLS